MLNSGFVKNEAMGFIFPGVNITKIGMGSFKRK